MEEAAKVGPDSREENHARGSSKLKDKRLLIAIATVIILILVIIGALLLLNNKKSSSTTTKNGIPAELTKNVLQEQSQSYIEKTSKETINPDLVSPVIKVKPTIDSEGKNVNPNRYYAQWTLDNGTFVKEEIVFADIDIVDSFNAFFVPEQLIASLSAASAPSIVGSYFSIQPQGQWLCKQVTTNEGKQAMLCENFWIDTNSTKKGIGILNTNKSTIYYCEIYPTSRKYSQSSCSTFKANN